MNKNLDIIKNVVLEMGGVVEEFISERNCFYIKFKNKNILLERNFSISRQSFNSTKLTRCKDITSKLLLLNSLPSPKVEYFYNKSYDKNIALKKLKNLKYPIILKNATGSNSRGVFPDIKNNLEAIKILKKELPFYRSMIAQEMVFGKEYRILVLDKKIIAALEMVRPYIEGDGVNSIRKIIRKKQDTTLRRTKFDKELKQTLKNQNVNLDSVLANKKIIFIKQNSCLAEGGVTKDVTNLVHKDIKGICVKASKVVGRYLVGIDVICNDISKKPTKKTFFILELNGKPDIYIHYSPTFGKSRNVVKSIIKFLLKTSVPTNN